MSGNRNNQVKKAPTLHCAQCGYPAGDESSYCPECGIVLERHLRIRYEAWRRKQRSKQLRPWFIALALMSIVGYTTWRFVRARELRSRRVNELNAAISAGGLPVWSNDESAWDQTYVHKILIKTIREGNAHDFLIQECGNKVGDSAPDKLVDLLVDMLSKGEPYDTASWKVFQLGAHMCPKALDCVFKVIETHESNWLRNNCADALWRAKDMMTEQDVSRLVAAFQSETEIWTKIKLGGLWWTKTHDNWIRKWLQEQLDVALAQNDEQALLLLRSYLSETE